MPSLLGALDAKESECRARVAELRKRIADISEAVSQAEAELSRLQITRETVKQVLADGPVATRDASVSVGSGPVDAAVALLAAEAAGDVTVISPDYQRIIALFATSGSAWRCKDVCVELGLQTGACHVEGMRSKLKRLVERGILAETAPGLFRVDGRESGW
ncbi:hypothetical protein OG552_16250 [Streptomyces sp. NBC_01476]|uniref:hypothetical protein n=1 Tax=Streptomyces sp. NBC_01476 TaxID=2903881 RepID=UPI002E351BFB|nr:hypothetical protein [Streptomyces sp. NBC_01476]